MEAVEVAEAVERVAVVLFFGEALVAVADGWGEVADAAADHEPVVVAEVVGREHRDAERAGLVVEKLLRERIAGGDQLAEALGFVAGGAGGFVERMVGPFREALGGIPTGGRAR